MAADCMFGGLNRVPSGYKYLTSEIFINTYYEKLGKDLAMGLCKINQSLGRVCPEMAQIA